MAKQLLNEFPFNAGLNAALKERFSATWDKAAKVWAVSSKSKVVEANALIAQVVEFEAARRVEETRIERQHILHARHPEAGIYAPHPLTGELWAGRIPAELRDELESIRDELRAAELKRQAEEEAIRAAAAALAAAEQAAKLAAVAPQLEKAAAIAAKAAAVKMEAAALADDLTTGIIDRQVVASAQRRMAAAQKKVGAQARDDFKAAQAEIQSIYDALEAAGLRSRGISLLSDMNFNRPDRDKPLSVTIDEILSVRQIGVE